MSNNFLRYSCKAQYSTSSAFFQHLKFSHALYPGRTLRLKCGEHGCSSVFYTYCGFKKHLLRVHGDAVASDTVTSGSADKLDTVDNHAVDNVCLIHCQVQLLLKKGSY